MTDALVLAPHPDDETLGCGGSIAHHTSMGRNVHIVFLTSGEQGVLDTAPQQAGPVRGRETEAAAGKLGVAVSSIRFLRLADGGLDPGDRSQFLSVLGVLRQTRPEVVYVPHAADASHDHRQAHLLMGRALEKGASRSCPNFGGRGLHLVDVLVREARGRTEVVADAATGGKQIIIRLPLAPA